MTEKEDVNAAPVQPIAGHGELRRRYNKALNLLRRVETAERKMSWETGESLDGVLEEVREHLSDLRLEKQLVKMGHRRMNIQ